MPGEGRQPFHLPSDTNDASWTQVVDTVDATDMPILVDGDSRYGNFNNARIVAKTLL
jgi:phosphoenolpyruvate phosphomutase